MTWQNHSVLMEFVFLAYPFHAELRILVFLGISLIYVLVITGNVLIVLAIQRETCLHTPMYYFLGSISGVEVCYTAVVVPHMLTNALKTQKTITLLGCATQVTFFIGLGCADCFLLAAMAYDRCVAICYPLKYPLIVTLSLCVHLVAASVVIGLFLSLQLVVFIFSLPFCQAWGIEHFFCDVPPVMQLVCANSHFHEHSVLMAAALAIALPFFIIAASYAFTVSAVLRTHSAAGRSGAFSTCSSHFTVVLLQYGCCAFIYMCPSSNYSPKKDQLLSLVYALGTPLLNPLIYTLRNNEVKGAQGRVLTRNYLSKNS
ncbi:olfactory receptor 10W1-like [Trichechus inunguis]